MMCACVCVCVLSKRFRILNGYNDLVFISILMLHCTIPSLKCVFSKKKFYCYIFVQKELIEKQDAQDMKES